MKSGIQEVKNGQVSNERTSVGGRRARARIAVLLATLSSCAATVQGFEATGQVVFYLNHFGEWDRYETNQFHITVSGCSWLLHLTPAKPIYDYREMSYDGTWIYRVTSFKTETAARSGTNRSANVATATVTAGPVPHDESVHEAGVLWLMFASTCYFSSVTNGRTEPAITFGVPSWQYSHENRYTEQTVFNLQRPDPALPESLLYLDEGFARDSSRPGILLKREPPYSAGFTNAVYRVLQSTNCGDLRLPTRAVLETYVPPRTILGSGGHLHLYTQYSVTVDNVSAKLSSPTAFVPELPGMTVVSDRRFDRFAAVPPYLTSKWLPAMQAQRISRTPLTGGAQSVRRFVVLVLMALLSAAPFLVVICQRNRWSQTKRNNP